MPQPINYLWQEVLLPTETNGTFSRAFAVPKDAKALTLLVPDLVGAASTLLLQVADPSTREQSYDSSATWYGLGVFDLTDGTREALDSIPESAATTLPVSALGSGILRFVASTPQMGAVDAITVRLIWAMD